MAEPEDLTLQLLREIRSKMDDVSATQSEHTLRFDKVDEQLEAMAGYVTHAIGLSSETRVDIETIREDLKALAARVRALEEAN